MKPEDIALSDHWGLTIIMIVVASWILYTYIAPKGLKEWRNVGFVQAFIIALYAEMYGFPLTIYILTSFLGLDLPWMHIRGHLWATLLGLGDNGAMIEMIVGFAFIFAGLTLIFDGWYLIYTAQKKDELVTDGIYRYMRHPQYTGIFLALFGQLIHWPTVLTLALFPIIVWAYYSLSRKEQKVMISKFGEGYRNYAEKVPMFFPKIGHWRLLFGGS